MSGGDEFYFISKETYRYIIILFAAFFVLRLEDELHQVERAEAKLDRISVQVILTCPKSNSNYEHKWNQSCSRILYVRNRFVCNLSIMSFQSCIDQMFSMNFYSIFYVLNSFRKYNGSILIIIKLIITII